MPMQFSLQLTETTLNQINEVGGAALACGYLHISPSVTPSCTGEGESDLDWAEVSVRLINFRRVAKERFVLFNLRCSLILYQAEKTNLIVDLASVAIAPCCYSDTLQECGSDSFTVSPWWRLFRWWRRLLSGVDVWHWHSRRHSECCQCPVHRLPGSCCQVWCHCVLQPPYWKMQGSLVRIC